MSRLVYMEQEDEEPMHSHTNSKHKHKQSYQQYDETDDYYLSQEIDTSIVSAANSVSKKKLKKRIVEETNTSTSVSNMNVGLKRSNTPNVTLNNTVKSTSKRSNNVAFDNEDVDGFFDDMEEEIVKETSSIEGIKPKKKKKKKKQSIKSLEEGEVVEDVVEETQQAEEQQEEQIELVVEEEPSKPSKLSVSGFLRTFLSKTREKGAVEPLPTYEPMRDGILHEFVQENQMNTHDNDEDEDDSSTHSSVLSSSQIGQSHDQVSPAEEVEYNDSTSSNNDTPSEELIAADNEVKKVMIFNLPYSATEKQIATLMEQKKIPFSNIEICMDKKRNLPSGIAFFHLRLLNGISADVVMESLKDTELNKRKLRFEIQIPSNNRNSRSGRTSDVSNRYYENDISCKCYVCGQVGHKSNDCMNTPLVTPCTLCAGIDHESQGCPNIICFRCCMFGHHSKNCTQKRFSKLAICSKCGGNSHENAYCRVDLSVGKTGASKGGLGGLGASKFESKDVVCMVCGKAGHVMCKLPPVPSDK